MKTLRAVAPIVVILALIGCIRPAIGSIPETDQSIPESSTPPSPAAAPAKARGTLAYVGADGNIWVTSPAEGWTQQVTSDATAPPEGQGRSYHRVAWGRDGSLAFAAVVRSRDEARSQLFVQQALGEGPRLVAQNDQHFFIYLYGSPAPCSGQAACPSLAYLIEEENGVGLHLVTVGDDDVEDLLVAIGRPFYLSWSPDGQEILWHTGGALRENPAAEIELYRIEEDRRNVLPYAPGTFLAPAWSPQGEDWLSVAASDGADRLHLVTPDEVTTLATTAGQGVAFVWSPDGRRVAYAVRKSDGTSSYGPVQMIDLETGKTRRLTSDAFNVLGFFWSPDGRRLAYLSRLDLPDAVWMQWRVFDLRTDRDRGFRRVPPLASDALHHP